MTQSRFYALPRHYCTSSGDPRGALPASPTISTIMRFNTWFQHGSGAFASGDPSRVTGRPYITDVLCPAAAAITDGTLLELCDGFGGLDTFEFRGDGGPATPGNILVAYGAADPAADVRDAFLSAANSDPLVNTHTTAASQGAASVRFTQSTNYFGGRTGFNAGVLAGSFGLVRSQSLPAAFLVTETQTGYDFVLVVPAMLGGQPKWIGTLAHPIFLVT
jgi:hypothetical protein